MKTNLPYRTPTVQLTRSANQLSVHQLTAYTTLLTVHKTSGMEAVVPRRQENTMKADANLTISRGGFFFRGSAFFNNLPLLLRTTSNEIQFKREVKKWVKQNIDVKPG